MGDGHKGGTQPHYLISVLFQIRKRIEKQIRTDTKARSWDF